MRKIERDGEFFLAGKSLVAKNVVAAAQRRVIAAMERRSRLAQKDEFSVEMQDRLLVALQLRNAAGPDPRHGQPRLLCGGKAAVLRAIPRHGNPFRITIEIIAR